MSFYKFAGALCTLFFKLAFRFKVEGRENIPTERNYMVVSNHISNLDPPLLGTALREPLTYMAKEELFKNRIFAFIIRKLGAFPVNRSGGDIGAVKTALRLLKSGKKMVIFPEGGRSRVSGQLRRGKSGAVMMAHRTDVLILPVGISAEFKFRGKVTVKIGEPIDLAKYSGEKLSNEEMQEITDNILMPKIASLAGAKVYGS